MTDEVKIHAAADSPTDEKRYPDPHGLYRRWFDPSEDARDGADAGSVSADELTELWRRWFEGAEKNGFAGSMAPLWKEMAEDLSAEMLSGETLPEDPLRFFLRWYDATSEKWSKIADELLKKDEVLESTSRFLETHARSHGEFRRVSEEGLKNLQIPTRSDVARVARLVVGVENKVDRLEERMDRLEGKVDRLLAALEKPTAPLTG